MPLCRQLGRIAITLAAGSSVDRVEVELLGGIADRDARVLSTATLLGVLRGHTEEEINEVDAPSIAEERGIEVVETTNTSARDFTDLVRVTVVAGDVSERVVGTTLGRRHRPHLLEAWGQRFNLQLDPHLVLFRNADVPGMIGKVGTCFGEAGVNIVSMAVGRKRDDEEAGAEAVMAISTDAPVPDEVVGRVLALDGFRDGRAIAL